MKPQEFRGLAWNSTKLEYYFVYGMPSYGFETEEVQEIGTKDGDFVEINPETIGVFTEYTDRHKKKIYTGDITKIELQDGEIRVLEVVKGIIDREFAPIKGFDGEKVKVRVNTIAFKWGEFLLFPCVDSSGKCDTEKMEIIGDIFRTPELLEVNK